MKTRWIALLTCAACAVWGQNRKNADMIEKDTLSTSAGDLTIFFVGHGSLAFRHGGKVIHVDPVSREADYATMPKADLILVTHDHGDHLDPEAIAAVRKDGTKIVVSQACAGRLANAVVLGNGERRTILGLDIETVPAYNIVHKRPTGQPFHPKGNGNGYIIAFGETRVYVAGDTENVPEIKGLEDIHVAFLPMNLPYTMTPEMVADVARAIQPSILYPYHFGNTDTDALTKLLSEEQGIEVRVRDMQ